MTSEFFRCFENDRAGKICGFHSEQNSEFVQKVVFQTHSGYTSLSVTIISNLESMNNI